MLTQRIQGNIIPIIRYLVESAQPLATSKKIVVEFKSDLPELTMDFTPILIRELITNLLKKCLEFSNASQTITVQVSQMSPSHLTIAVAVKGIGQIDLTPYRKWLSVEDAEISLNLDAKKNTRFLVDFPIVNEYNYWDTQQVLNFIKDT